MRGALLVSLALIGGGAGFAAGLGAQSPLPTEFDVVSIRLVDELRPGEGMRSLPDGTFIMTNSPLGAIVGLASPVPVTPRDIVGMPEWMMRERYDVTAKPPAGFTREQLGPALGAMWRAVFAGRMRLAAHVEHREKDTYGLVLARRDGRLGPGLQPSTLDCAAPPDAVVPVPPQTPPSLEERRNRCGVFTGRGVIVSGSMTLAQLSKSMSGLAGGEIDDRTGLMGSFSVELRFLPRGTTGAANPDAPPSDTPDFFTAVQEQLGLKLQREKKMMPVFVIDHVERPSGN
jgi:uncharacterized protein (TIGR03435 family)